MNSPLKLVALVLFGLAAIFQGDSRLGWTGMFFWLLSEVL